MWMRAAGRALDGAALIMQAIAEGGAAAAAPMREAALTEGALLHHLSTALTGTVWLIPAWYQTCTRLA